MVAIPLCAYLQHQSNYWSALLLWGTATPMAQFLEQNGLEKAHTIWLIKWYMVDMDLCSHITAAMQESFQQPLHSCCNSSMNSQLLVHPHISQSSLRAMCQQLYFLFVVNYTCSPLLDYFHINPMRHGARIWFQHPFCHGSLLILQGCCEDNLEGRRIMLSVKNF